MNNNPYNIDDYINIETCNDDYINIETCNGEIWTKESVNAYNNFNNNKNIPMKNLNFIQKRKLDKFVDSNKADELAKLIEEAERIVTLYNVIGMKIGTIADIIDTSVDCLNNAVEDENISILESFMDETSAQLEAVTSKDVAIYIDGLIKVFGIDVSGKEKVDKKEIRKTLGLK